MRAEVFQALAAGLVLAAILARFMKQGAPRKSGVALAVVLGLVLAWLPVIGGGGLALWQWGLSFIDHISVTAVVFLSAHLLARAGVLSIEHTNWQWAMGFVLCYGLLLYASALGFLEFGIYESGYDAGWVFQLALAGAVAAGLWGRWLLWASLAGALLAHIAGLLPSGNLNDSLMDAWLFFTIVILVAARAMRGLRKKRDV